MAMRAAVLHAYGPPTALGVGDVPVPSISANQVLVKTVCTSVNAADAKQRAGNLVKVVKHKFPLVLGQDFSGVVVEVGSACSRLRRGDWVYGATAPRNGCTAEFIAVYEREATVKPDGISWACAAAAPTVACTAFRGICSLGCAKPGQSVLVLGAAGGVGYAAIRLARRIGCRVWGTCSPANFEALRSAGVEPIDYHSAIGLAPESLDLVLDAVGGDDYYHACLPLLRKGGQFVTAVGPVRHGGATLVTWGQILKTAAVLIPRLAANMWASRPYRIFLSFDAADLRDAELEAHAASGDLVRISPTEYAIDTLAAAHAQCETQHSEGKMVVRIAGDPKP
jgi:alcohol dehydrogenase